MKAQNRKKPVTGRKNRKRFLRIAVLLSLDAKVNRDRFSGFLRYASTKENWEIRILDRRRLASILHKGKRTLNDIWMPDAVVSEVGFPHAAEYVDAISGSVGKSIPWTVFDMNPERKDKRIAGVILTDDRAIGTEAAEFFLAHGYRNFAYVASLDESEMWHSKLRHSSFSGPIASKGHPCAVIQPTDSVSLERLAGDLKALEKPCAVFAYSDEVSRHVLDACRYADIPVPEQISLLGVDDQTEITENTRPALSSILPDFESSGYCSAMMTDDLLEGRKRTAGCRSFGVIGVSERASTQDYKGANRVASAAIAYIKLHLAERIRTQDIANAVNISPRLLEMRFRQALDCSVHDKVVELRIAKASNLLAKTSMRIEQIASECGYATADGLRLAFQRHCGEKISCLRSEARREKGM